MAKALEETSVTLTGATGFLGTALLERLLKETNNSKFQVIIRPGKTYGAAKRLERDILKNDCFDTLRTLHGENFNKNITSRINVVEGDISVDGVILNNQHEHIVKDSDIFIHSAATVNFDSEFDEAVQINILGPLRSCMKMVSLKTSTDYSFISNQVINGLDISCIPPIETDFHFISISTAYVSTWEKGNAYEKDLTGHIGSLGIDWRKEVRFAKELRQAIELESRDPKTIKKLTKKAEKELGGAGRLAIAKKIEDLRKDFIREKLVEIGRERAQSLGFPDVYSFSKCLGECAILELKDKVNITIIRPSIIEAALKDPFPGWIKGFRMADPIIISYAKGLLKEFPGLPEGTIDVIPVDFVVSATLGVMRRGHDSEKNIIHVSSGARNPLKYSTLVNLTRAYFSENPIYDSKGQPIKVPAWSFPGRHQVNSQLARASAGLDLAINSYLRLPVRGKLTRPLVELDEKSQLIKRAKSYALLYGAYTETETIFQVNNLLDLASQPINSDLEIDPIAINWKTYVHDIYLPSVVRHARVPLSKPKKQKARKNLMHARLLSTERHCAVFDLENTFMRSNVVETYAYLATFNLDWQEKLKLISKLLLMGPKLLSLDSKDRSDFLRYFYRNYKNADPVEINTRSNEMFASFLLNRIFPDALYRVKKHKSLGHKTVLVTGSLDDITKPLEQLFDTIISTNLITEEGLLTGEIKGLVPTGDARASLLREWADKSNVDLSQTVAYGDSISDLHMLEICGFPVAVNPDTKLALIANKRGWPIEYWKQANTKESFLAINFSTANKKSPFFKAFKSLFEPK